jgi:hypothetical protein
LHICRATLRSAKLQAMVEAAKMLRAEYGAD